jgi:hypothetical protein
MVETSIAKFKENFKEALLANIHKSYGSIEEFADDKGYSLDHLNSMLHGNFGTLDEFLKLLLDTNWNVTFTDHFDHNFNFPDSFTIPGVPAIQMNNFT